MQLFVAKTRFAEGPLATLITNIIRVLQVSSEEARHLVASIKRSIVMTWVSATQSDHVLLG